MKSLRLIRWVKSLRLILWVPLVAFLVFMLVFAHGLNNPTNTAVPSALVGQPLPEFTLQPAVAGKPGLATVDFRQGRAMVINVFASWCVPCRAEAPQLAALKEQGVPLVGIAVRDRPDDLAQFLSAYGDPFSAIGADVDRRVQLDIGSGGVPETFVIDGRGVVRYQHIGAINPPDVATILGQYQQAAAQ